jgi:hypothetical protein
MSKKAAEHHKKASEHHAYAAGTKRPNITKKAATRHTQREATSFTP